MTVSMWIALAAGVVFAVLAYAAALVFAMKIQGLQALSDARFASQEKRNAFRTQTASLSFIISAIMALYLVCLVIFRQIDGLENEAVMVAVTQVIAAAVLTRLTYTRWYWRKFLGDKA